MTSTLKRWAPAIVCVFAALVCVASFVAHYWVPAGFRW